MKRLSNKLRIDQFQNGKDQEMWKKKIFPKFNKNKKKQKNKRILDFFFLFIFFLFLEISYFHQHLAILLSLVHNVQPSFYL